MKYQDEYRDRELVQGLAARLRDLASGYHGTMTFMEVCGTHTMAIYQYGLRGLLPPQVRLISGPGCPVCVTPNSYLDKAIACCRIPGLIVATFGDMLRVPGTTSSLMAERAKGADVRIVYSPLDAVKLAAANPGQKVVFLGVGFETTAPTIAGSILAARQLGLKNFFVLASHKTMPVPMAALASDPELAIDGFICPAHVSTIIGADAYQPLAHDFHRPCVITGFEPADVMQGVAMLAAQVVAAESRVEIQYRRAVKPEGNPRARAILAEVFVPCDAEWRGLGLIPGSGLAIREEFAPFDAERMLALEPENSREPAGCRCGDVLKGKISPFDCPLFASACTPEAPVGACMVSTEGTCAAAYKYGR
ncbi:hydrogenase isoenzymes formation protein HypD [Geobacter sp. OR-1]|uniref:hydrogenase formation protein HypD n=1 Tax=Geobacter sp. OR-1 TaxID=1266765 RepID=UPI000543BE98|nr:hydrogenase formation protein HypD [Geobacter sp. OR-1]GAM08726.1 hydrogenase isoenzymes formation protein HypD [Geobacter sp. OR-1]